MKIEITSRHFTISNELKDIIFQKIKKIEKFDNIIISCNVILKKEVNFKDVEIIIHCKGHEFISHSSSTVFKKSLISSINKIYNQIKKYHDKKIER